MKKHLLFGALLCSTCIFSQTPLLDTAADNGNFEAGTAGWTLVNGNQKNKWVVGGGAIPGFGGNNSIYISSSAAAPFAHHYDIDTESISYFYKDLPVPAGAQRVWVTFDYICNGDWTDNYDETGQYYYSDVDDALDVLVRRKGTIVTAGSHLNFGVSQTGLYNQPTWKRRFTRSFSVGSLNTDTVRLIFQWRNNQGWGNQPPAAVDNIEVYATCEPVQTPRSDRVWGTSAFISWTGRPTAKNYQIRYKKTDEPDTVATFRNGQNRSYPTAVLSQLQPGTTYQVQVNTIDSFSTCNEFSAPLFFTTVPPPANDEPAGAITVVVQNNACSTPAEKRSTFKGASLTASVPQPLCGRPWHADVWYKFQATDTAVYIQAGATDFKYHQIENVVVYDSLLQPVATYCGPSTYSGLLNRNVMRFKAGGLSKDQSYYIRLSAGDTVVHDVFVCVFNKPEVPGCVQLISPANGQSGIASAAEQTLTWSAVPHAAAYSFRIYNRTHPYDTQNFHTTDTAANVLLQPGGDYVWKATALNVLDETCGSIDSAQFTTCAALVNRGVLSVNRPGICRNDSVQLFLQGVSGPYHWFKDGEKIAVTTANTLWVRDTGFYMIAVDSAGCLSPGTAPLLVRPVATPPKVTIKASGATRFCEGGSVGLEVNRMISHQSTQWYRNHELISGGQGNFYNAIQTGAYYAVVTNSTTGCSTLSDTIQVTTISRPAAPHLTAAGSLLRCTGDSVLLRAAGTGTVQWYWNNNPISGAVSDSIWAKRAGTYTATLSDSVCTSVQPAPFVLFISNPPPVPVINAAGNALSAPDGFMQYQWYLNGSAISGATTAQHLATQNGSYTVAVYSSVNCFTLSLPLVHVLTSLSTVNVSGTEIKVYPNPVADRLTVVADGSGFGITTVQLFTAEGRLLQTLRLKKGTHHLTFTGLAPGMYSLVFTHNGARRTVKVLKK